MGAIESTLQELSETSWPWNSDVERDQVPIHNISPQDEIDFNILNNIQPSTQNLPWTVDFQGDLMVFLDLQSLGRSLQVCRSWYLCIRKDEYWKRGILPLIGKIKMSETQWKLYADVLSWVRTGWAHAVLAAVYCGRVSGIPRVPYLRNNDDLVEDAMVVTRFLHPRIFSMHTETSWFHRWVLTRGRAHPFVITIQPNKAVVKLGEFLRFRILIENVSDAAAQIFTGRDTFRDDLCEHCRWRETPLLMGFLMADADWPQPLGVALPCCCANLKNADDSTTPADPKNVDGPLPISSLITIDAGESVELFATFEFTTESKQAQWRAPPGLRGICGLRSRKHFMPLVRPNETKTMVAFGNAIRARRRLNQMQWDDLTLSAPVEIKFDASS